MSLRYEQYRALKRSESVLSRIAYQWDTSEELPLEERESIQEAARGALRHFPYLDAEGEPYWSQDEFTKDRKDKGE